MASTTICSSFGPEKPSVRSTRTVQGIAWAGTGGAQLQIQDGAAAAPHGQIEQERSPSKRPLRHQLRRQVATTVGRGHHEHRRGPSRIQVSRLAAPAGWLPHRLRLSPPKPLFNLIDPEASAGWPIGFGPRGSCRGCALARSHQTAKQPYPTSSRNRGIAPQLWAIPWLSSELARALGRHSSKRPLGQGQA